MKTEFVPKYPHQVVLSGSEVTASAYLQWLAEIFSDGDRLGSDVDEPEGSRTLVFSDTMAKKIASALQMLADGAEVIVYED